VVVAVAVGDRDGLLSTGVAVLMMINVGVNEGVGELTPPAGSAQTSAKVTSGGGEA
jgi:hypothetical protein